MRNRNASSGLGHGVVVAECELELGLIELDVGGFDVEAALVGSIEDCGHKTGGVSERTGAVDHGAGVVVLLPATLAIWLEEIALQLDAHLDGVTEFGPVIEGALECGAW